MIRMKVHTSRSERKSLHLVKAIHRFNHLTISMQLTNKTILVISPQAWGQMYLSKHHYALTLAQRGNTVYFLNPPKQGNYGSKEQVKIVSLKENLYIIEHTIGFPYNLRFHALPLFHWFMKFHVRRILTKISKPLDIVWSFDQLNMYSFRFFDKSTLKIFQPVDEPGDKKALKSANGADIILSVTKEILSRYSHLNIPQHLVNHGINEDFLSTQLNTPAHQQIHVGFSGNLLRDDIDRETFLQIVRENQLIVFECWGCYKDHQSNIGGQESSPSRKFIESLKKYGVILHGPVSSIELAKELNRMDAFLICYDVNKDPSKGTNYHKVMEYLSTGKIVISSNITRYEDNPELVLMVKERDNNKSLPALFRTVIQNLDFFNNQSLQEYRREFAKQNTYTRQVEKIEHILAEKAAQLTAVDFLVNIA